MDTAMDTREPMAWVGCLSCYNAGQLTGEWVSADEAADYVPCRRVDHEEYWVMDHEYLFIRGECSPSEAAARGEIVSAIPDHIPNGAIWEWVNDGNDGDDALARIGDAYYGTFESAVDFAQELIYATTAPETMELIEKTVSVDWDHTARELRHDFSMYRRDGQLHVFWNNY